MAPTMLVVVLLIASVPAGAQSETFSPLSFEFGDMPSPAPMPPGASETFPVSLIVRCQADNVFVDPPRIDLELDTQSGEENAALFQVEPTSVELPFGQGGCSRPGGTQHEVHVNVTASVPSNSRAFVQSSTLIVVHYEGERERSDPVVVQTAFAGRYETEHQSIWKTGRNQRLSLPIHIENTGNDDLMIRISSEHGSSLPTGGDVALPATWILRTPLYGTGDHVVDLPIDYRSTHEGEGPVNETISVVLAPVSAYDNSLSLEPTPITFHIQVEGIYVDAPAAHTLLPILAVLALASVAGRRRPPLVS